MPTIKKETWKLFVVFLIVSALFLLAGYLKDAAFYGGAMVFVVVALITLGYERFISK